MWAKNTTYFKWIMQPFSAEPAKSINEGRVSNLHSSAARPINFGQINSPCSTPMPLGEKAINKF